MQKDSYYCKVNAYFTFKNYSSSNVADSYRSTVLYGHFSCSFN